MTTALLVAPRRRPTPGFLFVLAVAVAGAVLLGGAEAGLLPPEALLALALPLGPLGAPVVVGAVQALEVLGPDRGGPAALPIVLLLLAALIASAAASVLLAAARLRRPRPTPDGYDGRLPYAVDRMVGTAVLLLAGEVLCALTVLAAVQPALTPWFQPALPPPTASALLPVLVPWGLAASAVVAGTAARVRGRGSLAWSAGSLLVVVVATGTMLLLAR